MSFALENQVKELSEKVKIYEEALRRINAFSGRSKLFSDRDIIISIADKALDKVNPHRSCPKCGEDCIGWVSDGVSC